MIDLRDENTKNAASSRLYGGLNATGDADTKLPSMSSPISPYLSFDPAYLPPSQPEFIFPEGAVKQRGRFELAFSQIGAVCIAGAGIGGVSGLYRGVKATSLAGQTGKPRRTQLINHVMKSGSSLANTLGIVSVMYSGFGVLLSWARGTDDALNTLAAATATGMLFKSTTGLRRCALSGAVGFGIASIYCLWNNRDTFSEMMPQHMNSA